MLLSGRAIAPCYEQSGVPNTESTFEAAPTSPGPPAFRLSEHARDRLAERTKLTEADLLVILEKRAYCSLHSVTKFKSDTAEFERMRALFRMTVTEMVRRGFIEISSIFRHVLIWSHPDQRPLTLIVEWRTRTILTVLYADLDNGRPWWRERLTPEILEHMRKASDLALNPSKRSYELFVRWLDDDGFPRRKAFAKELIRCVSPLDPSMDALITLVRGRIGRARDVYLTIRDRKDTSHIIEEVHFDQFT